jgi:flagellar hook protein FlgE
MSFQQGLSGLNATSKNLEVIGNNIANANTYGSKVARAEFSDMYAASLNGAGSSEVGIGTTLATVAQQFTQGNISTTSNPLDLAINGAGFFQLIDAGSGATSYTRNGQFKVDADGYIVNNSQQRLAGIPQGENAGAPPSALRLPTGAQLPPKATTAVSLELNLKGNSEVQVFDVNDSTTYSATSVTMYDLSGNASSLALYFSKKSADLATGESEWDIYVGLPLADPTVAPVLLTTTAVKFNASGTQPVDATTGLPVTDLSAVPLWAGALPPQFGTVSPTLDLSGMTAFASSFAVSDLTQDGYAPGSLQSINVAKNGDVEAIYTNGETLVSGTVILTAFRNPQGLRPVGDNAWVQTGTEGEAVRDKPGNGSFGSLQSRALEESNIDLTNELVNMITAQRIYQANAQTIKTQDQVMQTLVNLR